MTEDAGFNLKTCYFHDRRLFIQGYAKNQCELMLRFGDYYIAGGVYKCITVARVESVQTPIFRQYVMTSIL